MPVEVTISGDRNFLLLLSSSYIRMEDNSLGWNYHVYNLSSRLEYKWKLQAKPVLLRTVCTAGHTWCLHSWGLSRQLSGHLWAVPWPWSGTTTSTTGRPWTTRLRRSQQLERWGVFIMEFLIGCMEVISWVMTCLIVILCRKDIQTAELSLVFPRREDSRIFITQW